MSSSGAKARRAPELERHGPVGATVRGAQERERVAVERERIANEREALADEREALADEHEFEVDERELAAGQREELQTSIRGSVASGRRSERSASTRQG